MSQSEGGELCMPAVFRNFDTTLARRADNAADFEPGKSYNYDEANCYHSGFKDGATFAVRGFGDTLVAATMAARAACLAATGH